MDPAESTLCESSRHAGGKNDHDTIKIHFLDADSQESRFELDQFFEWDGDTRDLFHGPVTRSRLMFRSDIGALLTVASDGKRLIARRIDVPAGK